MKVQIKGSAIELTSAIKDYVEKRILSLEKYIHEENEEALAMVEVGKITHHHRNGDVFRAEVSLVSHGRKYYAAVEKDDLYAAIDEVKDEIMREMISSKEKRETLLRRGGAKIKSLMKRLKF
ncbi:MAG TPA: ribosome-associated translation inhibitor RaiA [Candidatus Paceibacterota bacterium]